jgi:hypothetical protein
MKKKKRYTNKDIFKIKNHIHRVSPHASKVDVKIDKLPSGEFKSFIRVLAPRKKELIAQKKDQDLKKCLEKSHFAIIRQIHRIKTKWDRTSHKLSEFTMSA